MRIMSVCLAIMAGLLCGIKLPAVKICLFALNLAVTFVVKILIKRKIPYGDLYVGLIALMFFVSAFCGCLYDRDQFAAVRPLYGTTVTISGTVTETNGFTFVLDDGKRSYNVYNNGKGDYAFKNSIVTVKGRLTSYNTASFRGDTDFRIYYAVRGIYGKINAESVEITGYDDSFSLSKLGGKARNFINRRIDNNKYFAYKGFTKALLTGSTEDLDPELREDFSLTGISHLIAVSGLHFGIFLGFFSAVIFRLRRHRIAKNSFVITLVVLYMLLIGERASVLRAAGMAVLGYSFTSVRRRRDSLTNLMLMGVAICAVNPYYVVDMGFQMSFVATLGIVLYSPYIKRQTVGIPVITMLFMLPVTLYYSNVISIESVPVNIVAVALSTFIIIFGYLGCAIPAVGALSSAFAGTVLKMASFFADMDFLHISVPSTTASLVFVWLGVAAAAYFMLKGKRTEDAIFAIVTAVAAAIIVSVYSTNPAPHSIARFVNMGDFNMTHIVSENGTNVFIDCGYKADSYMTKYGIDDVYIIMISEDISSKYSGLEKVCKNRKVTAVLLPEKMRDVNLNLENCQVLYYNQNNYTHTKDNLIVAAVRNKGKNYVGVSVYGRIIAIPSGTTEVSHLAEADVICVPKGNEDCGTFAGLSHTFGYIHATDDYSYYDYGHKYITFQEGMKEIVFQKNRTPIVR